MCIGVNFVAYKIVKYGDYHERRNFSKVNPTNALQDGNDYGQDSYLINSYDKAGNVTKINLNTSGKF